MRVGKWPVSMNFLLFISTLCTKRELASLRPNSCPDPGSRASAHSPILWSDLRFLDAHGALFVIGLPRHWIEGALRHLIDIRFGVVKGHEDLPGRDNFRNTKLDTFHASSSRNHVDAVMRLQSERLCVPRIHLQPCVWRETFEDRNVSCFRAGMPMLDRAARIQHEWKVRVRLFRKGFPHNREKPRLAILSGEMAIGVEPRCLYFRGARWIGPLNPAVALDELVRESRIIAEASCRYLLPFVEGILRLSPSRKKFPVAA